MPLVRDRVLVLQSFAYGETSKILRLLTREHGVRSVIAKGAQRPKSRYGGLLEPFTEGEALFFLRDGRDLHTLSGFDLLRSRQALGRDLTAFAGASVVAELLIRTGTEEPNPRLFESALRTLDRLASPSAGHPASTALAGIWEMIARLGFEPELQRCVHCDRPVAPDESTRFDPEAGGIACPRCRPSGRVVAPAARAELAAFVRGDPGGAPLSDPGMHRALLRVFLPLHLQISQPLRSLDLFLQQLR